MFDSLSKFLNSLKFLNWTRVAELFVVVLILICALTFYENRNKVYESIGVHSLETYQSLIVDDITKKHIEEIVVRSPLIIGIHIVEANFIKNERTSVYVKVDDQLLQAGLNKYMANKVGAPPIFSINERNNNRMVRLINNEFVCLPFNDTIAIMFGEEAGKNVGTVCSVAIPPVYGKFRGYVTAYVGNGYTPTDIEQIRAMLLALSAEIANI